MHLGILNSRGLQQGAVQLSAAIIDALLRCPEWKITVINQEAASAAFVGNRVSTEVLPVREPFWVKYPRALLALAGRSCKLGRYRALAQLKLDLLVSTPSASLAGVYAGVPYLGTIADMMYRFYPDLPEFPRRERLKRQYLYGQCVRRSVLTVVDSECARDHAVGFLGVSREKTFAAPYIPPPYVFQHQYADDAWARQLTARFGLPERYLLYPAQFWSHKNHVRLLQALNQAQDQGAGTIHLALAGSKRGAFEEVLGWINRLGLADQVHLLGYVSDEELVALYKRTVGLVFPSLFGPTNIPLTEAIVLGVPLACSNLFAMPEQVGDAGLLFDPFSVPEMAARIATLWTDANVRDELRRNAARRADRFSAERFSRDWIAAVQLAAERLGLTPAAVAQS